MRVKRKSRAQPSTESEPSGSSDFEMLERLNKDLKEAARTLGPAQARYLTDLYYEIQEFRKASGNQKRALKEGEKPNRLLNWVFQSMNHLEDDIRKALDAFTDEWAIGRWMKSITGIGPVISAGLLSHLDIRKARTVGHFWRFAGLDPAVRWVGVQEAEEELRAIVNMQYPLISAKLAADLFGRDVNTLVRYATDNGEKTMTLKSLAKAVARRPWNARLKTLCWKVGECFIKFQHNKDDFYGAYFSMRKAREIDKNQRGEFAELAKAELDRFNVGKDTKKYPANMAGKLHDGHINDRARRWTVKLFISHVHRAMYVDFYHCPPPVPFVFDKANGDHRHFIEAPNWPWKGGGRPLKELLAER